MDGSFKINVNGEQFIVTRDILSTFQTIYRISKERQYLFSLTYERNGAWQVNDTAIITLNEDLVRAIGDQIERADKDTLMA